MCSWGVVIAVLDRVLEGLQQECAISGDGGNLHLEASVKVSVTILLSELVW